MRARDKQRPTEKKKKRVVLVLYFQGKNSEKPKRWVGEGGGGNQCLPNSRNFLPQLSNFPVFFLFCLDITN